MQIAKALSNVRCVYSQANITFVSQSWRSLFPLQVFNRRNPNGSYKLNLQDPPQRHIAVELARIRQAQVGSYAYHRPRDSSKVMIETTHHFALAENVSLSICWVL